MTITLQPKLAYALLDQLSSDKSHDETSLKPAVEEKLGHPVSEKDFLGHLDYMNQRGFIQADFSGDAYADKGPNPLPSLVSLKDAQVTSSGQSLLQKLEHQMAKHSDSSKNTAISPENMAFLEKVMAKAGLPDVFDARDITEVVFRTMRDMMGNEAAQNIASELRTPASKSHAKEIQEEVADLWLDTNPIVSFISSIRPPLEIDDSLFLRRVNQEGAVPKQVSVEKVVSAIFSATKAELSSAQVQEIENHLPGQIKTLWQEA
ncbi:DUF2267 domain-containing protein [Lyngbya confervoides]|uniref:DUF2267 domain-containing protein n=1 Tax=Lyngbya confervoides BDU141951 TaxID=1574623 RepID=A0ABD4T7B8_9CYAN|nr:DUF2267 domain-containing protein [Lyngbya confervoides]MCM1984624.1 DUF2267 domain-containing protein [Lyngbya confervoides BDU141951]